MPAYVLCVGRARANEMQQHCLGKSTPVFVEEKGDEDDASLHYRNDVGKAVGCLATGIQPVLDFLTTVP